MSESARRPVPEKTVKYGEWAARYGQTLEKLYSTEERQFGLIVPDIDVEHVPPAELARFPDQTGLAEYTFEGWMDRVLGK